MSFLFSLKGKVSKTKKPEASNRKTLGIEEKQEVERKTIDGFDLKKGAMLGAVALSHTPQLIIKPLNQSTTLRKKGKVTAQNHPRNTADGGILDEAARSLIEGVSLEELGSRVIPVRSQTQNEETDENIGPENSQKDYEEVPVEEFGAALLRGMGWKGPDKNTLSLQTKHCQRGVLLGIGAKPLPKEIEQELLDRKNLSVPLIKRE